MKKNFVYMVWGLKIGKEIPLPMGLYYKEDDAWKRFNELFAGMKKLEWKWLDVKKMEVK